MVLLFTPVAAVDPHLEALLPVVYDLRSGMGEQDNQNAQTREVRRKPQRIHITIITNT